MIDKAIRQFAAICINLVTKYRVILISVIILGLFGYTLLKLPAINNPQPDPAYINSQNKNAQVTKIQIKDSLKQQLEKLQDTPVNVTPNAVGKPDPFNP